MRRNITFFVKLLLFLILFISTSCEKPDKSRSIEYSIADSIALNEPTSYIRMYKTPYGFVCINWDKTRVELISNTGELLSFHGNKGNGPGEFINPFSLDIYENQIFVGDTNGGKISISQVDTLTKNISYDSEFLPKVNFFDVSVWDDENIFVTRAGSEKNLVLFNSSGKLQNKFSATKLQDFNTKEKLFKSLCYIKIAKPYISLFFMRQNKLAFYRFDKSDSKLTEVKEIIDEQFEPLFLTDGGNFYILMETQDTTSMTYRKFSKSGEFECDIVIPEIFYILAVSEDCVFYGRKSENYEHIYIAKPAEQFPDK